MPTPDCAPLGILLSPHLRDIWPNSGSAPPPQAASSVNSGATLRLNSASGRHGTAVSRLKPGVPTWARRGYRHFRAEPLGFCIDLGDLHA